MINCTSDASLGINMNTFIKLFSLFPPIFYFFKILLWTHGHIVMEGLKVQLYNVCNTSAVIITLLSQLHTCAAFIAGLGSAVYQYTEIYFLIRNLIFCPIVLLFLLSFKTSKQKNKNKTPSYSSERECLEEKQV